MRQPPTAGRGTLRAPRVRPATDYLRLTEQVRAAGLLARRPDYYLRLGLALGGALVLSGLLFVALGDSWWQLGTATLLAFVFSQAGFFGHDAAHHQVLASHRANRWLARLVSGLVVGLSHGWWTHKHSRHHSAPNQVDRDPDIAPGALVFTSEEAAERVGVARWFARRQGSLFFPLLLLEGLNLHASSIRVLATRADLPWRRLEAAMIVVRLGGYLAGVLLVLSPLKAAAFLAVQLGLFGVLLGGAFAPNHKGMPVVRRDERIDFLRRQVLMSRNIRGGVWVDVLMGGLNYQVEHHLFPNMPRANLAAARPLVMAFCAEAGVRYTETTLVASYAMVIKYLNNVGPGHRDPFECPLVREYRG